MKQEVTINHARSRSDGIVFYSSQEPGLCVTSIVTEEGEYITSPSFMIFEDLFSFLSGEYATTRPKWATAIDILALVIAIVTSINDWIHLPIRIVGALYFILTAEKYTYGFLITVLGMKFGSDKTLARFHAAEHKVINAYKRYGGVPSMEELRQSSPYSKDCSSRSVIRSSVIDTMIALAMLLLVKNTFMYISVLVAMFILFVLDVKLGVLLPLQRLVFNNPTDVELTVALNGIKEYDAMEKRIMEAREGDGGENPEFRVIIIG